MNESGKQSLFFVTSTGAPSEVGDMDDIVAAGLHLSFDMLARRQSAESTGKVLAKHQDLSGEAFELVAGAALQHMVLVILPELLSASPGLEYFVQPEFERQAAHCDALRAARGGESGRDG